MFYYFFNFSAIMYKGYRPCNLTIKYKEGRFGCQERNYTTYSNQNRLACTQQVPVVIACPYQLNVNKFWNEFQQQCYGHFPLYFLYP
jgi:hypothetical protein